MKQSGFAPVETKRGKGWWVNDHDMHRNFRLSRGDDRARDVSFRQRQAGWESSGCTRCGIGFDVLAVPDYWPPAIYDPAKAGQNHAMKSSRKPRTAPKVFVDGPAVVSPLHVLDRPATDRDMKPITGTQAWRKLTPLQAAFAKKQLEGGSGRYTAADRYAAAQDYTAIFDAAERPGKDSTQALNIIKGGSGGSSTGAQAKAASELACIHSHMGEMDRCITMLVCGWGCTPPQAIRRVLGNDYEKAALPRFREALDALCDALEKTRRRPGEINMRRMA